MIRYTLFSLFPFFFLFFFDTASNNIGISCPSVFGSQALDSHSYTVSSSLHRCSFFFFLSLFFLFSFFFFVLFLFFVLFVCFFSLFFKYYFASLLCISLSSPLLLFTFIFCYCLPFFFFLSFLIFFLRPCFPFPYPILCFSLLLASAIA